VCCEDLIERQRGGEENRARPRERDREREREREREWWRNLETKRGGASRVSVNTTPSRNTHIVPLHMSVRTCIECECAYLTVCFRDNDV